MLTDADLCSVRAVRSSARGSGVSCRNLLTDSVLLATISGALGIVIAVIGTRLLTELLANGQEGFTLCAELNWHALAVTLTLSLKCGVLFGLAPAIAGYAVDADAETPEDPGRRHR